MFIRVKAKTSKKEPALFRKSVQIVENFRDMGKVRQKIVKHVGVAHNEGQLDELKLLAQSIIIQLENENNVSLFTPEDLTKDILVPKRDKNSTNSAADTTDDIYNDEDYNVDIRSLNEESRVITGIHDIYGNLFDELKLDSILKSKTDIDTFKNIVLARIAQPDSKSATVNLLERDFGVKLDLSKVYRMMDKLDDKAIEKLNRLSYDTTKRLFNDKIDVIYFDATTIYFESFSEDEFKKNGYSKDLKFNQPQVVLALMITKEGLPIGYEAFSGDTFDGHTLIPSLKILRDKYNIDKVVYVADSGMFNKKNLEELETLEEHEFNYIVGARIKNLSKAVKEEILKLDDYVSLNADIKVKNITLDNGRKLVVTHSLKREKKDRADRLKGIEKLRAKLQKEKGVKAHLSNQGYKKYLQLEETNPSQSSQCDVTITIDEEKIQEDAAWDGLKGLIVNATSTLSNDEILTQYNNLWQVEESFRITKHDLKIRPVYHWKPSRVKAHIAISFSAFMLTRYLEHRVRKQYKKLSPARIKNLLLEVQTSLLVSQEKRIKYALPSNIKIDTQRIYNLMGVSRKQTPYILEKF
ncbi:MAG TPA: IS1634 family transposase [Epsilonproteobacteria bacterium]|nr:IS1634 family transposase [Campylobacterota bacterium]